MKSAQTRNPDPRPPFRNLIQVTDHAGHVRWLDLAEPERVIEVTTPTSVLSALEEIERAVKEGYSAAGFLTYEAASGLDPALRTRTPGMLPLLRFGIYRGFAVHETPPRATGTYHLGAWTPSINADDHARAIGTIKDRIASGETYQVNFTLRLRAPFHGEPAAWFHALQRAQNPGYAAFIEDGADIICSVSPELFFSLDQQAIQCRPMKGTAQRGLTWAEDQALAMQLHHSTKNRAENLMIVDMMRNDLGRIARTGSVHVERLFEVERYPTVLQLTSDIRARTSASFPNIMRALYPSASITGAPKVRTMEIIKSLEEEPRGVYTGSIGCLLPNHPFTGVPGRFAQFNVAIRTAHIRRDQATVEYGTGGGIVWDSESETEYRECHTKALILKRAPPDFSLLETLLWKPGLGYFLLEEHLTRLETSARYFGRPFDRARIQQRLDHATTGLPPRRHRVRLLLTHDGRITVEPEPLRQKRTTWRVALDDRPIDRNDPFLYHKTTHREIYDQARARHPEADDVLLWNARGELTESCAANLIMRFDTHWYTPPVAAGLLDGTLRSALVRRGRLKERILTKSDIARARQIALLNSVRGYITVSPPIPPQAQPRQGEQTFNT